MTVIQSYSEGLAGIRAANPDVHVRIDRDPSAPDERVLIVDDPARTADPAGRDMQCAAGQHDWTGESAISFQIRPDQPARRWIAEDRVTPTAIEYVSTIR